MKIDGLGYCIFEVAGRKTWELRERGKTENDGIVVFFLLLFLVLSAKMMQVRHGILLVSGNAHGRKTTGFFLYEDASMVPDIASHSQMYTTFGMDVVFSWPHIFSLPRTGSGDLLNSGAA